MVDSRVRQTAVWKWTMSSTHVSLFVSSSELCKVSFSWKHCKYPKLSMKPLRENQQSSRQDENAHNFNSTEERWFIVKT